jgi:hypothetical protein
MSITLSESFAERMKADAAKGLQTIETIADKFVADGKAYDVDALLAACKASGTPPEKVDEIIELKRKIVNGTREVFHEEPEVEADIAEATRERLELEKEEQEFKRKLEERRKENNHKYNQAYARKQELRELKNFVARHCKTPAYIEASSLSNAMLTESKSTASEIRSLELATAQEPRRTIAASGMHPSGQPATSQEKETAKSELAEIHAKLATLNRRYQLLQIQIPIQVENCVRSAVNQAPLALPVDYRRGTIGQVIPVYLGESHLDEVQQVSAAGEGELLTPGVSDPDTEARRIQAENASKAAGTLPTRKKSEASPKPSNTTDNDLELI